MLAKNSPEILVNDGELDKEKSSYFVSLWDDFLPIQCGTSFYVNLTVHIDLIGNLWFVKGFKGCFLKNL